MSTKCLLPVFFLDDLQRMDAQPLRFCRPRKTPDQAPPHTHFTFESVQNACPRRQFRQKKLLPTLGLN